MKKKVLIFLLFTLPFALQLGLLPIMNRIHPIILGLPLLHFWLFAWIILTPVCTWGVYKIHQKEGSFES
ncbi:DUF3311 domain-containing protein [Priestia koreensis]|uniref:DUF3311 domain-containing protein n=1 Tax=Priestia koreensis TaxID=284581 RepID=UPI003D026055